MTYKVLVVDDSTFFQIRLKDIINEHPELNVVGIASNGQEAIEKALALKPDIISMDYEMPFLDGVSAVRAIMAEYQVPIVMFSSMTYEGARITLDALDAGAVDFIPKNFAEVSRQSSALKKKLQDTLLNFARKAKPALQKTTVNPIAPAPAKIPPHATVPVAPHTHDRHRVLKNKIKLIIIGSSTGGPVALADVLEKLPRQFPVPIIVVQHMPQNFTRALADRLNNQCQVSVKEAATGDTLEPGHVYVAPGGHQLIISDGNRIKILPGDNRINYKPCVDVTFTSAANHFGETVLGVVLTGMGSDGCEGARILKQKGAIIWGQDQASCVVYGMPKAVASAGLTDEVIKLSEIGARMARDI